MDWESFGTFAEAEARAKELVRREETYVIEQRDQTCPRCTVAMNLKTAHDAPVEAAPLLKYPWQQAVLDAFTETRYEFLPLKVNAAQRAISARLCEKNPTDLDEQIAIKEALHSLSALLPEPKKDPREDPDSRGKKATA